MDRLPPIRFTLRSSLVSCRLVVRHNLPKYPAYFIFIFVFSQNKYFQNDLEVSRIGIHIARGQGTWAGHLNTTTTITTTTTAMFVMVNKIQKILATSGNLISHGALQQQEMKAGSAQAESCCVYVKPEKLMQHMHGIISQLFDCWAYPVAHLLILKSSMDQYIIRLIHIRIHLYAQPWIATLSDKNIIFPINKLSSVA